MSYRHALLGTKKSTLGVFANFTNLLLIPLFLRLENAFFFIHLYVHVCKKNIYICKEVYMVCVCMSIWPLRKLILYK
ncbi:hypothetical protein PUN28_003386 [Cardiocondyla obscurior]|uniref:Uncharacterized protein n=1 Tax=Cardiocondyla obscurior TaxID=286306 RepID=A0AAW2GMG5_9HYME